MDEVWPWLKSLFDTWAKIVTGGIVPATILAASLVFPVIPRWLVGLWLLIAIPVASFYSWRGERRARQQAEIASAQRAVYIESTRSLLLTLRRRLGDMRSELQQHQGTSSASNHAAGIDQVLTALFDPVRTAALADPGLEARIHDRAVRAAAMLSSRKWDFRPTRPGGFHQNAIAQITSLQAEIYDLYNQLGT
jgi:hypothetical protein